MSCTISQQGLLCWERCFLYGYYVKFFVKVTHKGNALVASLRGFEPPTYRLGGGRSIRLSYNDKHYLNYTITNNKFQVKNSFLLDFAKYSVSIL